MIEIREARATDVPLVVASWSAAYRQAHAAGMILLDDWPVVMERQIRRVLARSGCRVLVAGVPGEGDTRADAYGWIAYEPGLVHFVYIKRAYRRLGIASRLLAAAGLERAGRWRYSCKTAVVSDLREKIPSATWDPMAARIPEAEGQWHQKTSSSRRRRRARHA